MRISLGQQPQELNMIQRIPIKQSEIKSLEIGDVFEGEILDIRQNLMLIQLKSNQEILAKLFEQMELNIGQKFLFQVKDKTEEQIIIKPYIEDALTPQEQKVIKALEEAGLPLTTKNMTLVKALIQEQQPITKLNLQKYHQLTLTFKEAPIEDVIFFDKNNLPITKEHLAQLAQYKTGNHELLSQLKEWPENLGNHMETLTGQGASKELIHTHNEVQQILLEMLPLEDLSKDQKPVGFQQETAIKQQDLNSIQLILKDNDLSLEDLKLTEKPLTLEKLFKTIGTLPPDKQEKIIMAMVEHKVYEPLVKEQILGRMLLQPEQVSEEALEKVYKNIEKLTSTPIEALGGVTTDASKNLASTSQQVKDNMDFMRVLNQMFNYIQVPVKLKNQTIHSDLYVYNKKSRNKDSKNVSVLLRLDLSTLGQVDIYMDKQENTIHSQLYIDKKDTQTIVRNHLSHLVHNLSTKGYTFIPQIMDQKKEFNFVQDFLNQEKDDKTEIKRFSFDIRV
jgi:hypothetical protein